MCPCVVLENILSVYVDYEFMISVKYNEHCSMKKTFQKRKIKHVCDSSDYLNRYIYIYVCLFLVQVQ